MTGDIKKSLKECSELTKSYYKNGQQKSDYDKVFEKIVPRKSLKLKINYINKMNDNLQNPSTAPKTY